LGSADSDSDGIADVLRYSLIVEFPSGQQRPAVRMAEENTDLDLACIEVSSDGLTEGYDYVVVPAARYVDVHVGDRVIVVGNPLGRFSGTHTFGRVSALRDQGGFGEKCKVIQHDAAINPGNSGGPLFVEQDDEVFWIGVNTWRVPIAQGIFLSIAADEACNAHYSWATADPAGAAELISTLQRRTATVSPRAR